jgi:CheY-like chemotaxis protein
MFDSERFPPLTSHNLNTDFQNLMRRRVQEILVVSSLYDSFLLAQDGQIHEQMTAEFMELNLSHEPNLTRVSHASQALELVAENPRFDLVITTMHLGDMQVLEFARELKKLQPDLPVVLLAFDNREFRELMRIRTEPLLERVFIWQGDFRILLAIVKYIEDRWNVEHDTSAMGVQTILLIEDNIRFYSSYLPMVYTEIMRHSQNLISESVNLYHKLLRMRARPKILLCDCFEEAWDYYTKYENNILGVISDVEFPQNGTLNREAGAEFTQRVKERRPDIPILLQSSKPDIAGLADELGVWFALKDSPTLLEELRRFMELHFGFGDFIFRLPSGKELDRAPDMRTLELRLRTVPAESIRFHAERDHFSNWLKARTEFELAQMLKPRKVSDYATLEDLRRDLIECIGIFRIERARGHVADFSREVFDPRDGFARIGTGSLGGKARGLAFANHVLHHFDFGQVFDNIRITVPPSVVLCTDVFDQFLDRNNLRGFALQEHDGEEIEERFLAAEFPTPLLAELAVLLDLAHYPLAVRSSSLLEDSQFHPFAGVYKTYMLPNNDPDPNVRLKQLAAAIKRVYASIFSPAARSYIRSTPYRLEEEKMAVIIQKLMGSVHEDRFYPDISGVARSHNFYPAPPLSSEDGVVVVALGLGKTVVEGGSAMRFCPKYPRHLMQFSATQDLLAYAQKSFYALDVSPESGAQDPAQEIQLDHYALDVAERDGTLAAVGSTYCVEDDAVHDGIGRDGMRLVNFAPILKHGLFPLPEIATRVLDMGTWGMNGPVEIEFAVNLSVPKDAPREFGILQVRPFVLSRELEELEIGDHTPETLLCQSPHVLGVGRVDDVRDVVVVDIDSYDRSRSGEVARDVGRFNAILSEKDIPYLLIGVGRWGSADPWLGIPVSWEQVSGARIIIESGFKDFKVEPSQGAHFFQNLIAYRIGYFTVNPDSRDGSLDWQWLKEQPAVEETKYVRHLRFGRPLVVRMNGHRNQGVILKPE